MSSQIIASMGRNQCLHHESGHRRHSGWAGRRWPGGLRPPGLARRQRSTQDFVLVRNRADHDEREKKMNSLLESLLVYMVRRARGGYRSCVAMAWTALTNPWTDDPHEDRLDRVQFILMGILVALGAGPWALIAVMTEANSSNAQDRLVAVGLFVALTLTGRRMMLNLGRGQKWMEA